MGADIRLTKCHKNSVFLNLGKLIVSYKSVCSVLFVFFIICTILDRPVCGGPLIYNPAFMQGPVSVARNIRHLPCISRRTGEEGVCMFAIDCLKSNGSHLGTCIDRFYFGSCCQIPDHNVVPQVISNNIEDSFVGGAINNGVTPASHRISTVDLPESKTDPTPDNNRLSTIVNDLKNATNKFTTTTEEPVKFSTFQTVVDIADKATTVRPTTTAKVTATIVKVTTTKPNKFNATNGRPKPPIIVKPQNVTKKPSRPTFKPSYKPRPSYRPVITNKPLTVTTASSTPRTTIRSTTTSRPLTTAKPTTAVRITYTTRPTTTIDPYDIPFNVSKRPIPPYKAPPKRTTTTRKPSTYPKVNITSFSSTKKPTRPTSESPITYINLTSPAESPKPSTSSQATAETTTAASKPTTENPSSLNYNDLSSPGIVTWSYTVDEVTKSSTSPQPIFSSSPPTTSIVPETTTFSKPLPSIYTTSSPGPQSSTLSQVSSTTSPPTKISSETLPTKIFVTSTTESITSVLTSSDSQSTTFIYTNPPPITISEEFTVQDVLQTNPTTWQTNPTTLQTNPPTLQTNPTTVQTTTAEATTPQQTSSETVSLTPSTIEASTEMVETLEITTATTLSTTADEDVATTSSLPTTVSEAGQDWSPITPPDGWVLISTLRPTTEVFVSTTTERIIQTSVAPSSSSTSPSSTVSEATRPADEPSTTSSTTSTTTKPPSTTMKPYSTTSQAMPEFTVNVTLTPAIASSTAAPPVTVSIPNDTVTTSSGNNSVNTEAGVLNGSISSIDSSSTLKPALESVSNVTGSNDTSSTTELPLNMTDYKQVCGRRLWPQARIVGGDKSGFGRWPWQISLRQWRTSTYLHKCGAALLNENWAVTAAHCVDNVPPSELLVRLGEHDLANEAEPYGFQERRIQIVASHPHFEPATFEYDLALLRFYEPVKFQPNILPVCVPDNDDDFVGQTAYVTGWGRLYDDGPLPSVLQEVAVPIINNSACEGMYRVAGFNEHIPNIFICAGRQKGGADSCEGDSGGPMVLPRKRDGRFVLSGVISWGIGCAEPNQPGVYTRISEFREWINQILQF